MAQRFTQVDAFTDRPFAGNPAAVCVLVSPRPDAWMQDVAREMNLSETAFLLREGNAFRLRWFTPLVEEDLCGHATLASAHVLWDEGFLPASEIARFHTRSGLLTAQPGEDGWIRMDFPAERAEPLAAPAELLDALGAPARWTGRNRMDWLVELESEDAVRSLTPDIGRLARVRTRGVIATARADGDRYDFVSRFFAPGEGIPEDPVTGSAHCALAPFWEERLGRAELTGFQASARGGTVRVRTEGNRVRLEGRAVTVLRGELVGGAAG